jgi:hypothetical protein
MTKNVCPACAHHLGNGCCAYNWELICQGKLWQRKDDEMLIVVDGREDAPADDRAMYEGEVPIYGN